ncbi:MAG TPA: hypothetical protein VD886_13615 [Herpetosiphonaceae bacterium]|nr:hypothetical protein [Herpetosiphonaceae bacterium]
MTTVRRSVEQTVSRMVRRTLRDRAGLAGLPGARPDAVQALATLIDHRLAAAPAALGPLCAEAVERGIGCLVVPLDQVAAAADLLAGSGCRVGALVAGPAELDQALDAGAGEIEIAPPAGLLEHESDLAEWVATIRGRGDSGFVLKLDLAGLGLPADALLRVCAQAASLPIDYLSIPAGAVADVQRTLNPDMGIKVDGIATLEAARQALAAGASRLGTGAGPELLDLASGG